MYEFSSKSQLTPVRLGQGEKLFAILQMYEFSSKSQQRTPLPFSTRRCLRYCKCTSFQANHNGLAQSSARTRLFAILQMYEFSSKSQLEEGETRDGYCCLRYCKCTSFQANHNEYQKINAETRVVCDTANVRVFKQITTNRVNKLESIWLFAILQMYEFSSKSQLEQLMGILSIVVCDTAKVRVFKQITTNVCFIVLFLLLFAILQKYEFSSKSQPTLTCIPVSSSCLRYCKSTSFQANHNHHTDSCLSCLVVCDTANVRVFKQITTSAVP